MSFGFTPAEYLEMVRDAVREFRRGNLSKLRAVTCAVLINHLPEQVFAAYSGQRTKVRDASMVENYRGILTGMNPDLGIVRDLCDYAKHGPTLGRSSVRVEATRQTEVLELDDVAFLAGFIPSHHEVEKLVIVLKDGNDRWLSDVLESALKFWEDEFVASGL